MKSSNSKYSQLLFCSSTISPNLNGKISLTKLAQCGLDLWFMYRLNSVSELMGVVIRAVSLHNPNKYPQNLRNFVSKLIVLTNYLFLVRNHRWAIQFSTKRRWIWKGTYRYIWRIGGSRTPCSDCAPYRIFPWLERVSAIQLHVHCKLPTMTIRKFWKKYTITSKSYRLPSKYHIHGTKALAQVPVGRIA